MDRWDGGSEYEAFMGRWSRLVAEEFVRGVGAPGGLRWLDVGCGTGALLGAVVKLSAPTAAVGVDPSREYVEATRTRLGGEVDVRIAGGVELPFDDESFDLVVSGLVLNFISDPPAAVREWKRVTRPGGSISAYVWDYADGMEFLRYFWDAVVELDPSARHLDEAVRFPICQPNQLVELFLGADLSAVESGSIEVATPFTDFNDYWTPFLRGQGPAPGYVAALTDADLSQLKGHLSVRIPQSPDGTIDLTARAWTIIGTL